MEGAAHTERTWKTAKGCGRLRKAAEGCGRCGRPWKLRKAAEGTEGRGRPRKAAEGRGRRTKTDEDDEDDEDDDDAEGNEDVELAVRTWKTFEGRLWLARRGGQFIRYSIIPSVLFRVPAGRPSNDFSV